ncbi:hypothetical protein ACG33_14955 [Steroidobacter denitrificans]|uniref:GPI inositol-deacylase PGAP1-like alpha/beta domain-containing protein n=1 Tax=Steroidobacter denitrificans TaxID=465721 RepID=A0A127FDB2_STEDE|nr:alpha/beta fold hydrolase [Steroidobacter denitrificans]AMN48372.1 hypothetical protein ACG33_14955 [Steroidobacter denitrificans]
MPLSDDSPGPGDLHEDQIVASLRSGAHAALLCAYFGEPEYHELCRLAKLAAAHYDPGGTQVFVLPGIMGSRLGTTCDAMPSLLWLNPAAISQGELLQLAMPGPRSIRALGVMLPGYLKLKLSLEIAGFRTVFHSFDWRCDLDRLAREFIHVVETAAAPAFVVGHSMGGLVARCALAYDRHMKIAKLIQIGAPNEGSFAPIQALRAAYPTVRKIAALDRYHSAEELARRVFLTLPGLYQMLPSAQNAAQPDFFDPGSWPRDALPPDTQLLAHARRRLASLPPADERCMAIVGVNQPTVVSAAVVPASAGQAEGFEYAIRPDGDGTVPSSRALWKGARTWFVEEMHGALTTNDDVIATVADLLGTGRCGRLGTQPPPQSGDATRYTSDRELRREIAHKVNWDDLSPDTRRRILEPVVSAEFRAPAQAGSGPGISLEMDDGITPAE